MRIPTNIIGCVSEADGEEVCTNYRGQHFDSDVCKEARSDGDYQLIYGPEYVDQVTVFMIIHSGVVDTLLVLDTPELASEHTKRFLEDYGYSNLDEYTNDERTGNLKTEFKVCSRNVLCGVHEND